MAADVNAADLVAFRDNHERTRLGRRIRDAAAGFAVLVVLALPASARFQLPAENALEADAPAELDVFLPGDRSRERLLDRARRLVADQRWSDAAAAVDELLSHERDAFVAGGTETTRGSIRSEAAAIVEQLPRPGRDAYDRLFGGRAAKQLAAAVAADDPTAIMAVARRWLHTPAGRQAAVISAVRALEAGQPLAASGWLDQLAGAGAEEDPEPTLSVMRAATLAAIGETATAGQLLVEAGRRGRSELRLGGRDLPLRVDQETAADWLAAHATIAGGRPATARDWRQFRGTPPRNGIVVASRPLLVPRYRVPLVRHPEEARGLERHRLEAAAVGDPLVPAGSPVAVGDRLVVRTPLGILAVDFESGRRVWLESAEGSSESETDTDDVQGRLQPPRAFLDVTSGNLASDGRLVFAVESRPEALLPTRAGVTGLGRLAGQGFPTWDQGNAFSAYDLATGNVRWRLEGRAGPPNQRIADAEQGEADASRWYMGPPLVVGDQLFLLVEDRGEVRVECRAAADGGLRWAQPLATYDDGEAITSGDAANRRLAGLTPAFAEGVLVCPIGGGCVVAVNAATRSLLWAHAYPRPDSEPPRGGFRPDLQAEVAEPAWPGEPAPVIAAGRVILAPFDAKLVICLSLRDGKPLWQRPRAGRLAIAGAVDGRLLISDAEGVEAIEMGTGRPLWRRGLGDGVRPSGRGILTPQSLLVPCDAPAVVEIALVDGSIVGRSAARGGGIPGNLVAHRGEVISQGVDSLEVFHQQDALDGRIETARAAQPDDPWADYWSGQAAIDAKDIPAGLAAVARAAAAPGFRIPPGDLAAALVEALRADFPVAARLWATFPVQVSTPSPPAVDRVLVDGFLERQDPETAWASLRRLLLALPDASGEPEPLLRDPGDGHLAVAGDRWVRSRLIRLMSAGGESLREQIDETCRELAAAAAAIPQPGIRYRMLHALSKRLGPLPAADEVRRLVLADPQNAAEPAAGVRAALLAIGSADAGALQTATAGLDDSGGWPLGRVDHRDTRRDPDSDLGESPPQLRPVPIAVAAGHRPLAAHAAIDIARQRLVISDRLGRPLTQPLAVAGLVSGSGLQFLNQSAAIEVAALGGLVFVRSTSGLTVYDVSGDGDGQPLWSDPDLGTATDEVNGRWGLASRVTRDGAVPLGMRIHEPDERPRGLGRGMLALPTGLVVPGPRSLTVLDPADGAVLWQRDQLPAGLEWYVDDEFLCGCTSSGRGSLVLATADGRLVHAFDVPHRRQRLASQGRRFVAVHALDETPQQPIAPRVRLELVDPADREARPLGDFDGKARSTETGDGRLAVLEPSGLLTVLDLTDGSLVFRRELPECEWRPGRLSVLPWQDRYLVVAGTSDGGESVATDVSPLETLLLSGGSAAPLTGAVWAIDRSEGLPLWPVPALIERHCLHTAQPADLPVLVFCRILQLRGAARKELSVLCLDKRTGHAVFEDDRMELQGPAAGGCDLSANPEDHTVTIRDAGIGGGRLVLTFTGQPMAPRPPFRSRGRLPSLAGDLDVHLESQFDRRLDLPAVKVPVEE